MVGRTMDNDKGGLMTKTLRRKCLKCLWLAAVSPLTIGIVALGQSRSSQIGREVAVPVHLQDGDEFTIPREQLIQFGAQLFNAKFTIQEGAGRPHSKGTGAAISDPSSPLVFPRNFDRISSPDANSCSGCHNAPVPGAGGDRVTEVFVLAQRFDRLTFDPNDGIATRGAVDESGKLVTMENATNDRKSIGMNGSGFVEMLARQMFQATLPVPGQVIPNDPAVEHAIMIGERVFNRIGCASCHATLPLTSNNNPGLPGQPGWIYFEPNPYNPATGPNSPNLQLGPKNYPVSAPGLTVDLTSDMLPLPRLRAHRGVVMVPAYTDLKLHDISAASDVATDPECEPLDQNQPAGSPGFFAGNCKFITRKLWGFYNQGGAFMHHGKFTTAREAVEAHNGEALSQRLAFDALQPDLQNDLIEFLRSLQVLPPDSKSLVVDEHGNPKEWPPSTDSSKDER